MSSTLIPGAGTSPLPAFADRPSDYLALVATFVVYAGAWAWYPAIWDLFPTLVLIVGLAFASYGAAVGFRTSWMLAAVVVAADAGVVVPGFVTEIPSHPWIFAIVSALALMYLLRWAFKLTPAGPEIDPAAEQL